MDRIARYERAMPIALCLLHEAGAALLDAEKKSLSLRIGHFLQAYRYLETAEGQELRVEWFDHNTGTDASYLDRNLCDHSDAPTFLDRIAIMDETAFQSRRANST